LVGGGLVALLRKLSAGENILNVAFAGVHVSRVPATNVTIIQFKIFSHFLLVIFVDDTFFYLSHFLSILKINGVFCIT
jgi:hypothetical protein